MCASKIKMNDTLLNETFRRFDVDKTGFISSENLKEVLGLKDDEAADLLKEVDKDGNGKIEVDEFMDYITRVPSDKVMAVIDNQLPPEEPPALGRIKSKRSGAKPGDA